MDFGRLQKYFGRVNFSRVNFGLLTMAESEWHGRVNFGRLNFGRLTMTESEWHGRVNFDRLQEYFGRVNFSRVNFGRLLEYFGRVNFGRVPLVAAVRNFAYQSTSPGPWCVRCLGTRPAC